MNPLRQKIDFPVVLWGLSLLLILGAVGGGLMITGGPAHQRAIRMDQQRNRDLNALRSQIQQYFQENDKLPETLANLKYIPSETLHDPETHQPYDYRIISPESFSLCATFTTDNLREREETPYQGVGDRHPAGHYCYKLKKQINRDGLEWMKVVSE